MDGLEFVFSLFGLLLGLALTEALSGLARALKAKHRVQIGWPTALLGLLVACDVVTFWMYGWSLRKQLQVTWPLMFGGFVVTGIYYVCASLIFPDANNDDYDAHFDRMHRMVLSGVLICNVALLAFTLNFVPLTAFLTLRSAVLTWTFFPIALAAIVVKDRRIVLACMCVLIALYPLSAIWR